jgi:hypothetical protein
MKKAQKMADVGDLFHDPNYESMTCQFNCGFVLFFPRGDDGFEVWNRMLLHKFRGCKKDQKIIERNK